MSSVIAVFAETEILVATDTLSYPAGAALALPERYSFVTKAFYLSHMDLLLACSGPGGFLENWIEFLQHKSWRGIESMSLGSHGDLRKFWADWKRDYPYPEGVEHEVALYAYGASENTGEMLGFEQVSWDDFEPKEHGFRVNRHMAIFAKPRCSLPEANSMSELPAAFFRMMQEQRANQIGKVYDPEGSGRPAVGGEMVLHRLTTSGCAIWKAGRFDDYERVALDLWGDFRSHTCCINQSDLSR